VPGLGNILGDLRSACHTAGLHCLRSSDCSRSLVSAPSRGARCCRVQQQAKDDAYRRTVVPRHARHDDRYLRSTVDSCRRTHCHPCPRSVWTAPVARFRTFKPNLTVNIVTQIHVGVSPIASNRQVIVEQLDVLAGRLTTAAQRGNPVATQRTTSVAPMHVTDFKSGSITATRNAVVRRALCDAPCLLHIVHLEVAEGDVPCVTKAAAYNTLVLSMFWISCT
jgi:hypothetical protein